MKEIKILNKQNIQTFGTTLNDQSELSNWLELIGEAKGKPERWVLQDSESYDPSDILETEERIDQLTEEVTSWIKLKAEYTIEIEDITEQLNKESRIKELKKLLSESDFRMTTDYFKRMSLEDQTYWDETRESWRRELRSLGV